MSTAWKEIEAELNNWIEVHEDELSGLVQELVSYPSVSTGLQKNMEHPFGHACAQLADATQQITERYDLVWQNHEYYAISATYGSPAQRIDSTKTSKRPRIAFFSHLDVVPAGSSGWVHPPFDPYEKDEWIYGRGSTDNKGPFSSVLFALRFLAERKVELKHDVTLFGGFDEEVGMDDAKWVVAHLEPARFNLISDCSFPVCVAEKGIFEIELACRANDPALLSLSAGEAGNAIPDIAHAKITQRASGEIKQYQTTGVAAHAAFPEGSENAFVKLAAQLADEKSLSEQTRTRFAALADIFGSYDGTRTNISLHDDFLGSTTCVPTVARYENSEIRILVNLRYPAIESPNWVLENFTHALSTAGFEIKAVYESPARPVHENSELVELLTDIVNDELGSELKPYAMGGATHARWIPGALGFGPGRQFDGVFPPNAGSGHQANEAVSMQHLKQAIKIYVRAILELDAR